MAEIVTYKGQRTSLGTCENLYYATYQKYIAALNAGFLKYVPGNLSPEQYALPDSGFRFRFPFPDEDHLSIGGEGNAFSRDFRSRWIIIFFFQTEMMRYPLRLILKSSSKNY